MSKKKKALMTDPPVCPFVFCQIRIFKDEDGSFVMRPRAGHETAAEDALMLATSWLEIQMRGGRVKLIRDARVC